MEGLEPKTDKTIPLSPLQPPTKIDNTKLMCDDANKSSSRRHRGHQPWWRKGEEKDSGREEDLHPNAVSIQQQLRRMKPEVLLKIKEEWIANIVPIPKKDGKVQMCIDYRDLKRASPKYNFPLAHIDMLVDNTTQHAFYSFLDGFADYNQI
ncbi:hypothetical protein CR513_40941, partial [Mucuna pruriens]